MSLPLVSLGKHHWASLWALLLITLALLMPRDGVWTIDDGVKLVGAYNAQEGWHVVLPDGSLRAALRDPAAYPSFRPPFAARETGYLRLSFSPWTMALWGLVAKLGALALALLPALGSLLVWLLLRRWRGQSDEVVFFLPLTFYGLILWEHSLALVLETAALVLLFLSDRSRIASVTLAAFFLGAGALIRPEAALLVPVVVVWLWHRERARSALMLLLVSAALVVAGSWVSRAGASSLIPMQVQLNFLAAGVTQESFWQALLERGEALWIFCLSMDANVWISIGLLLVLCGGSWVIFRGERSRSVRLLVLGNVALLIWAVVIQIRLWSDPLPPVALLSRNSFLYASPWVLLFLFYGTGDGRPFLRAALILGLLILVATPVFRGVHWGPRLLLPALPILFLGYIYMKERVRRPRWLWRSLLALTVIQTLSSGALVYGRKVETAERVEVLRDRVQTPLVVPSQSQVADLAPLWSEVEMFTAASPSVLRRFIADVRRVGTDTFWLLLPRSGEIEPMKRVPGVMRLDDEYEFETGLLWKTTWWLGRYEDVGDSAAWGAFYDELARREIAAGGLQRALPEHRSATDFAPSEADYHFNYAVTLGKLGYFGEAERELRSAVAADSDHREARELLGKITAMPSSSP
jgi:hypothetical protein